MILQAEFEMICLFLLFVPGSFVHILCVCVCVFVFIMGNDSHIHFWNLCRREEQKSLVCVCALFVSVCLCVSVCDKTDRMCVSFGEGG